MQEKEKQISGEMGEGGDFSFRYIFCAYWDVSRVEVQDLSRLEICFTAVNIYMVVEVKGEYEIASKGKSMEENTGFKG